MLNNAQITWLVTFKIPYQTLINFTNYLGEIYSDISYFEYKTSQYMENQPNDIWVVQLYFKQQPNLLQIKKQIKNIAKIHNVKNTSKLILTNLHDTDWVAKIKKKSKPINAGNFCIYNSHHKIKHNELISIIIDPTRAFGSGEHYTTKNCINALSYLKKEGFSYEKMLDVGCGSGILAIAMAKLWQKPVIATDIDEQSVIISNENISINKVENLITVYLSDGYQHPLIKINSPYDLITSNILAQPLVSMAKTLAEHLKPNGKAILSGFLTNQEQEVIAAHFAHKLNVIHKIIDNNWCVIILEKTT